MTKKKPMAKKISLDDVISELRKSSTMEAIVESGRIKGGLAAPQDGCHAGC